VPATAENNSQYGRISSRATNRSALTPQEEQRDRTNDKERNIRKRVGCIGDAEQGTGVCEAVIGLVLQDGLEHRLSATSLRRGLRSEVLQLEHAEHRGRSGVNIELSIGVLDVARHRML
jgi:hypothetical protein